MTSFETLWPCKMDVSLFTSHPRALGLEKFTDPISKKWGSPSWNPDLSEHKTCPLHNRDAKVCGATAHTGDIAQRVALGTGDLHLEAKRAQEGLEWSRGLPRGGDP